MIFQGTLHKYLTIFSQKIHGFSTQGVVHYLQSGKESPTIQNLPALILTGAAPANTGAPRTKYSEAVFGLVPAARKGGFFAL